MSSARGSSTRSTSASEALDLYAQTQPGAERIAWIEVKRDLRGAKLVEFTFAKDQNGILRFTARRPLHELLALRCVEDVFLTALDVSDPDRGPSSLQRLERALGRGPGLPAAVERFSALTETSPKTWRIVARLYGNRGFQRTQMREAFARAIDRRLGPGMRRVREEADLEIWCNLLGERLLVGLRLSDASMRHRPYQREHRPAALRPSLAAAMVLLSDADPDRPFLDPMCGSGTILAERLRMRGHGSAMRGCVLGGDLSPGAIRASQANLRTLVGGGAGLLAREGGGATVARKASGRGRGLGEAADHFAAAETDDAALDLSLVRWDARALPLAASSVGACAVNLPFDKQLRALGGAPALYAAVLAELARVVAPGGKICTLTSRHEDLRQAVRSVGRLEIERGYPVATLGTWGRIHLLRRLEA